MDAIQNRPIARPLPGQRVRDMAAGEVAGTGRAGVPAGADAGAGDCGIGQPGSVRGSYDYQQIEDLAAQLCNLSGGDWSRKYTKRNRWRKRAMALACLARGDTAGAREAMR